MTASISDQLIAKARELGFADIAIVGADAAPEAGKRLREWLAAGRNGDMLWMAEKADRRQSPKALWPEVKTVLMLGFPYTPAVDPLRFRDRPDMATISVYALGKDYHDVIKPRLKLLAGLLVKLTQEDVKVFVDTAPVMEKPLAAAAGLGWQGKHTVVISRRHGTWIFLGAIYTTAELPPVSPKDAVGACGSCTACITACPTGAIIAPYVVDARRCITYLTVEHKGPVDEELRPLMGNHVFGCDECLAACPWNKYAKTPPDPDLVPKEGLASTSIAELLALDDAAFREKFRKTPVKRSGRDRLVRNSLYAAGNSGDKRLLPAVEKLLDDPDPAVADAARWARERLLAG